MTRKDDRKKVKHQCQAIIQKSGKQCERWATHRNAEKDLWLCTPHKTYGNKRGKPFTLSQSARVYRRRVKKQKYKKSNTQCAFISKAGVPCNARVVDRLEDGRNVCQYHRMVLAKMSGFQQREFEAHAVDTLMDVRLHGKSKTYDGLKPTVRRVENMPDIEEQIDMLEEQDKHSKHRIRFKEPDMAIGKDKQTSFLGIDTEYYTPDFKVDYVYMLLKAVRRAEAQVNILFQQLQRIEDEEELLKQMTTTGTMANEKGIMDINTTITRHAVPVELKLKLVEQLTKAEAHYAKLLKQMEELPLVCLMVLRKMGVRWDRDAAMMVVDKIEKGNKQVLADFGAIDLPLEQASPKINIQQAVEMVSEDPRMAKNLKQLMEDDW